MKLGGFNLSFGFTSVFVLVDEVGYVAVRFARTVDGGPVFV